MDRIKMHSGFIGPRGPSKWCIGARGILPHQICIRAYYDAHVCRRIAVHLEGISSRVGLPLLCFSSGHLSNTHLATYQCFNNDGVCVGITALFGQP